MREEALAHAATIVAATDLPVSAELAKLGVRRVSVGGAFAFAALGTVVRAAHELREQGAYEFLDVAAVGARAVRDAFA